MEDVRLKELKKIAIDVRRDCVKTQYITGSGHLGGAFSALEMMVYLYFERMKLDTLNPHNKNRDIFILSKGHASLGYYSVLSRRGFFPLDELLTYRKINSRLQGHTHIDSVPGVECSTGSLGQGLSYGIGIALGYKKLGIDNKVYVMLGDGEMQEGQIWEAFLLLEKLKLDNLVVIIDNNKIQLDDRTENIVNFKNIRQKLEAFSFNVIEVNGNDFEDIERGFSFIKHDCSNIIISNTVKGYGISFMEDNVIWHAKKVDEIEYKKAIEELNRKEEALSE